MSDFVIYLLMLTSALAAVVQNINAPTAQKLLNESSDIYYSITLVKTMDFSPSLSDATHLFGLKVFGF